MREKVPDVLERNRTPHPRLGRSVRSQFWGFYRIPRHGRTFNILCGIDGGWEHVSVSIEASGRKKQTRLPTWEEMCWIKDLFWESSECVVQYHPPESDYVNIAEVLHLWRPTGEVVPMPPLVMV